MTEKKRPSGSTRSPRKTTRPSKTEKTEAAAVETAPEVETVLEEPVKALPTAPPARTSARDDRDYDEEEERGRDDDYLDEVEPRGDEKDRERGADRAEQRTPSKPTDEYLLQVYFDKNGRTYHASVLEFPEIKATGTNREGVVRDLENRLNNHLQNLRRRNEPVPEGFHNRKAIELMEIRVSQTLFRKLEQLSRLERVPMDQLVSELLTAAVERRGEKQHGHGQGQGQRPQHQQQQHRDRDRDRDRGRGDRDRDNVGNQRGGQQGNPRQQGGRHGGGRRGYQESLENRENFMEYVRNLEKGNWRKR